jgi:SAM-dependent methyltransferase
MKMTRQREHYIPPLKYHWLTRFYDPLVRLSTREKAFKRALLRQAAPRAGDQVLDLGCGTATLTIALAKAYPMANVVGIDADTRALAIARGKARDSALELDFQQASSTRMPLPDGSFDRVISSLFFHHLTSVEKSATLAETLRVLKPGGELHIADWGEPSNALMRALFLGVQLLDGFETTRESVAGALPGLLRAAGYEGVEETEKFDTPLGTMRLLRAARLRVPPSRGAPRP